MAELEVRTHLDASFSHEQRRVSYPHIFIPKFGDEIALMVTCIAPGELPIVLADAGTLKQVGTCAASAIELEKLMRVYKYEVALSPEVRRTITCVDDIMEVLLWTPQ